MADRPIATFLYFKSAETQAGKGFTADFRKNRLRKFCGEMPDQQVISSLRSFWDVFILRFGRKSLFQGGLRRNEIAEGCYGGTASKKGMKLPNFPYVLASFLLKSQLTIVLGGTQ